MPTPGSALRRFALNTEQSEYPHGAFTKLSFGQPFIAQVFRRVDRDGPLLLAHLRSGPISCQRSANAFECRHELIASNRHVHKAGSWSSSRGSYSQWQLQEPAL